MIRHAYLKADMFEGPIIKNLMIFAIPLWGSQVLQVFYNLVDMLIIGQFGGKNVLASIGATSIVYSVIIYLLMGIATGVGVLIAQQFGGEKFGELKETVSTSALISVICGVGMAVLAFVLTPSLLTLIKTPEDIFSGAVLYLRLLALGIPALILYNVGAAILQSIGDTKRPLLFLILSSVVHILIALVLVIPFKLDLIGVALATSISQYVSAVLVWRTIMKIPYSFRYEIKGSKIYGASLKKIFALGIPSGLQAAMFPISNLLVQAAINEIGTDAVAGTTAGSNAENLVYTLMRAIASAALVFAGQNFGAGNIKRIKKLYFGSFISNFLFGGALCAVIIAFAEPFTKFFVSDPAAVHFGVLRIYYICTLYFICGAYETVMSIIRGMGKSLLPMIGAIAGICVTRVIWVYAFYPANPTYSYLMTCFPISWTIAFIIQTVLFIIYYKQFSKKDSLPI